MRIAVYAGSFDPVTNGHLSILDEAVRLFERILVVVAVNPAKATLFSEAERVGLLREATTRYPNVTCASTSGLIVDFARSEGATWLLRGIRGSIDSEYEMALAQINQALAPDISTLFLLARHDVAVVSSSFLKELARCSADMTPYCPPPVERALKERAALLGGRS
jgi:pantetheine-phosphate adenylyltransferase